MANRIVILLWLALSCSVGSLVQSATFCPSDAISKLGEEEVQCNRTPPCIRWSWLTPAKCASMPLDSDWPTHDPVLPRQPDWKDVRSLLNHFLHGKRLLLVGDSISNNLYHGLKCEAARAGLRLVEQNDALVTSVVPTRIGIAGFRVVDTNTTVSIAMDQHAKNTDALLNFTDVAIVNFGLHFLDDAAFQAKAHSVFHLMSAFNVRHRGSARRRRLALYRETSAQSFAGTGAFSNVSDATCAPMSGDVRETNRVARFNAEARRHAEAHRPTVPIVPFYDVMAQRSNLMEERFRCPFVLRKDPKMVCNPDCTHPCISPTLYSRHVHDIYVSLASVWLPHKGSL